ncbi:hypothetical protein [Yoonia litorea]|uniref:Uncharacterized protein n=1 Tax=Yoonia litorea TaxID=1123755 RepID=A0A1I6LYP9_9RHOB|nr:hypothetical protein [Yoonia litorea]SFS08563.1 hypothetical protein SAMN05444714_1032 [Yoonia litorea]
MKLLSVLIGKPEPTPVKSGMTGHFKKPVDSAVIATTGVVSDHIVDTENHGGRNQAVYLFGDQDRAWWSEEMGRSS